MGQSAILRDDYLRGGCQVDGSAGSFVWNAGVVASILSLGVGVYRITLNPGADTEEHTFTCQSIGADVDRIGLNVDPVSATTLVVRASSAVSGGAVDADFYLTVRRMRTAR